MKCSIQINKQQYTALMLQKKHYNFNQTSSLLQKQTLAHEHLTNSAPFPVTFLNFM